MVKNLYKQGDSYTLELDRSLLERLGIDENTPLEIRTNDRGIYIQPAGLSDEDDLDAVMQQIEDRYESVFKKLAE
jgi:antitoxin component of MazEF toxin-antitoxin module